MWRIEAWELQASVRTWGCFIIEKNGYKQITAFLRSREINSLIKEWIITKVRAADLAFESTTGRSLPNEKWLVKLWVSFLETESRERANTECNVRLTL